MIPQDIANSLIALAFSRFCEASDWDSLIVDMILKYGDRLHRKSLNKLRKLESKETSKISLENLDLPVLLKKFVITVDHELVKKEPLKGFSEDGIHVLNLVASLGELWQEEENLGIITSKNYSIAVWKHKDFYYMFDPHDVGPDGLRKPIGVACIQRFQEYEKLVEVFSANIENLEGLQSYELHKVFVAKTYFKDSVVYQECGDGLEVNSEFSLYRGFETVKIIRAKSTLPCDITCPASVYYVISSLYVSKNIRLDCFTRGTMDMIVSFGRSLSSNCENSCFTEMCLSSNCRTPREFNWSFTMNDATHFIQLDIFKRGTILSCNPVEPTLQAALEEFLEFYCAGILVTENFMVSIWIDNGRFVVFYPNSIDSNGKVVCSSGEICPGVCIFNDSEKLLENLLINIEEKGSGTKFEIRTCHLRSEDLYGVSY